MVSSEKQLSIEKSIAYHLMMLRHKFWSGTLEENLIENANEAHLVINMDNVKTLDFIGDNYVKYVDFFSGERQ